MDLQTCFTDWLIYFLRLCFTKSKQHLVTSYLQKYFLTQASLEKLKFYRLLKFISFFRSYSDREEIVNGQTYISLEFRLIDFMKVVDFKANTYQRKQFLQFFELLQRLPP
jgi:hypothetical protein